MNTLDRTCSKTDIAPCDLWWIHQAELNRDDPRNSGDAPREEYKPHLRPCNCYQHLDGLDAFDNVKYPTTGGYECVIVQLSNGHVGKVNQITGEVMESWIPPVIPFVTQRALPDPF